MDRPPAAAPPRRRAAGERAAEVGATVLICEADECAGPVLDLPARGHRLRPAATRPTSTWPAPPPRASRCCGRRAATPTAWPSSPSGCCSLPPAASSAADRDVREGEVYRDGTIPYQRFRAWQLQGRTAGLVGLGAVGRATRWRLEGLGMRVIASDPFAADATHDLDDLLAEADVVSMHAAVTPETLGLMSAERFAAMKRGGGVRQRGPGRAPRPRRPHRRAGVGPPGGRRARPLRGRGPRHRPPAGGDAQRRAHPPHRRRHLRHRGQPHDADGRRPRRAARAATCRPTSPTRRC